MSEQTNRNSSSDLSGGHNRRQFLKTTAIIGATAFVSGRGAWADETKPSGNSPSEKVNIACIGVGGKGDSDSTHAGMYGNVVAICDVDDKILAKKAEKFPNAKKFNDYRKMFDVMAKDFDAITVSIPDHNHAAATMMGIKAGKHVYCQKPLSRTIKEARDMRMAAREKKVCTQMGNQGTATDQLRRGVEVLRAGILGNVKEVHVWTNRPVWPQAPQVVARPPESPVPAELHWDEWIGVAPMRPYGEYDEANPKGGRSKKGAYHTFNWRGWQDFGTGALGDMGCHTANMPYMGLELGYPSSVEAKVAEMNNETYPAWATITFQFPARGNKPPVKLVWWEGHRPDSKDAEKRNLPDTSVFKQFGVPNSGSLCIGEKGMMFSMSDYGENNMIVFNGMSEGISVNAPQILPRHSEGGKKFNNDEAQKAEWVAAIKAGKSDVALSNFDYAGMLTEFILLGNIASKFGGKKLEWDGPGMKVANLEEANKFLHREYRKGWSM